MKNKQGLWRLSPSILYGYSECQSCFWLNNHYGKPPMTPFVLNSAMDSILKHRYDTYRAKGEFPPEVCKQLQEDGIKPFKDLEQLNKWRKINNIENKQVGYIMRSKVDDVMVDPKGHLVPADYKSSGVPPKKNKQRFYRDQLAAYGFMFQRQGYKVSDRAYLLHYYPIDKTNPNIKVEFESYVDFVNISSINIDRKLTDIVKLLNKPYPGDNPECKNCEYYTGREWAKK